MPDKLIINNENVALGPLIKIIEGDIEKDTITPDGLDKINSVIESIYAFAYFDVEKHGHLVMPRISSVNRDGIDAMATTEFVNDCLIYYVLDGVHFTQSLTTQYLKRKKISLEWLHDVSLLNLNKVEIHKVQNAHADDGSAVIISETDSYDASRILFPDLYLKYFDYFRGQFFATIPSRDMLIMFRGKKTLYDRVMASVHKIFIESKQHSITDKPFLVTLDGVAGT